MLGERAFFKFLSAAILLFTLAMAASTPGRAAASPPLLPSPPNWSGNYSIKSPVPFVWLRTAASSFAPVITTIFPPGGFIASADSNRNSVSWDGFQWWGYVNLSMSVTSGWVEINSLERTSVSGPTATSSAPASVRAPWLASTALRVKTSVPYVWLRAAPDSYAGSLYTVSSTTLLVVSNANPVLDVRQWWWQVKHPGSGVIGWVEQTSLELDSKPGVTENPQPAVQAWIVGSKVRVAPTIAFSWLRSSASSWASVNFVVITGQVLELTAPATFDGIQWWWQVKVPNTQLTGWVEQNSLRLEQVAVATVSPVPSLALDALLTHQEQAAFQSFEHGFMIWEASDEYVYVMYSNGDWVSYSKADYASLPDNPVSDTPPSGLVKPIRGFGRVWGNFPTVRAALGWATAPEQGYTMTVKTPAALLRFVLMSLPDNREIRLIHLTAYAHWSYENK